jgi:peroxiredoxin
MGHWADLPESRSPTATRSSSIPKGKIAQVWVKVNPNTSASDVLAAIP